MPSFKPEVQTAGDGDNWVNKTKKENWLPVPGTKGRYEVSNLGRVKSVKILKPTPTRDGYLRVWICNGSEKKKVPVHTLVLFAFKGPRPAGKQARHYPDQRPNNNKANNLSWATPLTNQRDRDVRGTNNRGVRNFFSKLTGKSVREIRRIKHWPYGKLTEVAKRYGVSRTVVAYVRDRKSWGHIR